MRYLAHFATFPIAEESNWVIAVIVPFSDFFSAFEKTQLQALFIVLLICFLSSLAIAYFAKKLSNPIKALSNRIDQVRHLNLNVSDSVRSNIKEIAEMDMSVNSMALAFHSFIQYVPKEIVQQLLAQNKELTLGGEKKEVTVLFSDIANFTRIAEEIPTEILMNLLAEYFDGLSKIILRSQGTIDKYIGDSIMAFWNAPLDVPNHPEICAAAVLKCSAFVKTLNARRKQEGKPEFATRFGIHTGSAIVGNIGTPERMNYTLIGDTVNSASRLQGVNKIYGTTLLISEQVQKKLSSAFISRPLDIVEVKGKKQKITIFELMAKQGDDPSIAPTAEDKTLADRFTKAYSAYYGDDRSSAKRLFSEIHKDFPKDIPTEIYLKRLAQESL
jgi:adenylate cyclase